MCAAIWLDAGNVVVVAVGTTLLTAMLDATDEMAEEPMDWKMLGACAALIAACAPSALAMWLTDDSRVHWPETKEAAIQELVLSQLLMQSSRDEAEAADLTSLPLKLWPHVTW